MIRQIVIMAVTVYGLTGCGTVERQNQQKFNQTAQRVAQVQDKAPDAAPVVTNTHEAWLMGDIIQVAPILSPVLQQPVAWRPAGKVNLIDVGAHIAQTFGIMVDTSEIQWLSHSPTQSSTASAGCIGAACTGETPYVVPSIAGDIQPKQHEALPKFAVIYAGPLSGLLDYAANQSGAWWKFTEGKITFFRTLTETFHIPAVARKSSGKAMISATSGPGNGTGTSNSTSDISAGTSTGGITSTDEYAVDVWSDLEKTARVVAGGSTAAQIATNQALSSITVTGTPMQVKHVREWARGLTENLSQQVAITATMYTVDITNEDYYQWDPTVIFNKLTSAYQFGLTGAHAPSVQSSLTPAGLGVSVVNNATSGAASSLNGTQLALRALSSLGHVSTTLRHTVVTLNGVKAPIQIGRQIGYIPSTSTTTTANVGETTSIQTGSITVGFTANFYPQIINGKILLSMDVINSSLDRLPTRKSGNASVQTPETSSSSFSQSVSLTPGDALMLTGFSQDSGQTNQSGVGSPTNPIFGGGTDAVSSKKMIAIVIAAKVL